MLQVRVAVLSLHFCIQWLMLQATCFFWLSMRKTCPWHVYPLEPHFYIEKLRFAGVYLIFLFLLQNIDCGYTLESPRRGGSSEYLQSVSWSRYKKNKYTPANPSFFYIKVGFKGGIYFTNMFSWQIKFSYPHNYPKLFQFCRSFSKCLIWSLNTKRQVIVRLVVIKPVGILLQLSFLTS